MHSKEAPVFNKKPYSGDGNAWPSLTENVINPNISTEKKSSSSTVPESEVLMGNYDPYKYYVADNIPKNPRGNFVLDPRVAQFPRSARNLETLRSYVITTVDDAFFLKNTEKVRFSDGNSINLELSKRCLQIDAYYVLAMSHMLKDGLNSNVIDVTWLSRNYYENESLDSLLHTNECIHSKSDLVKGLLILESRGELDNLSDIERKRLANFKKITSLDTLLRKTQGAQHMTTVDGKKCVLPVEEVFTLLSLPAAQFEKIFEYDLDGKIGQLSKTEFAYATTEYLKQNNILDDYLLPHDLRQRMMRLMRGQYIDFSAVNKLTETGDTLYKLVNINPDLRTTILERMPDSISKLKKAIYIYIKMCLILTYDNRVKAENQNGEATQKHKNLNYIEKITPQNNEITCSEFNAIFAALLYTELDLHFKSEYRDSTEENYGNSHASLKFRYGKFIVEADAVLGIFDGDLVRVKLGLPLSGIRCCSKNEKTLLEFQQSVSEMYELIQQQEQDKFPWQEYDLLTTNLFPMEFGKRKSIMIEKLNSTRLRGIDAMGYASKLRKALFLPWEQEDNVSISFLRNNEAPSRESDIETGAVISINKDGFNEYPNNTHYYYLSSNNGLVQLPKDEIYKRFNSGVFEYIRLEDPRIPGIDKIT